MSSCERKAIQRPLLGCNSHLCNIPFEDETGYVNLISQYIWNTTAFLSLAGKKRDKAVHMLADKLQGSFPEQMSLANENDVCEKASGSASSHDEDEDSDGDMVLAAFG